MAVATKPVPLGILRVCLSLLILADKKFILCIGSPVLQAPPTPSGLISTEESDINPSEPEPLVDKKSAAFDIESKYFFTALP